MRCGAAGAICRRTISDCILESGRPRGWTGSRSDGRRGRARFCAMFQRIAWWGSRNRGTSAPFGDQSRAFGLRPLEDGVYVGVGEAGVAVDQGVLRQRHVAVLYLVGDFREASFLSHEGVFGPAGKIQVLASADYVAADEERDGRDVAVPGVMRGLGVAILAGSFEDRAHVGSDLRAGQYGIGGRRGFGGHGRQRQHDDGNEKKE